MFSSDQNIDTIAQLVEAVKRYASLKTEFFLLQAVEKTVRIISALVLLFLFMLIATLMLIFVSFAAAIALGDVLGGLHYGFLTMAGIYLLMLLLVITKCRSWIERPLVRFLAGILLEK